MKAKSYVVQFFLQKKTAKYTPFSLLGRESYIANPKRLNLWAPVSYWHSKENACLPLSGASPPREETGSLQVANPLSRDWRLTDFKSL